MTKQNIDISHVVALAQYLNDESVMNLLENSDIDPMNEELLEKLIPFLDTESKSVIFEKILIGELDWHMIKAILPYIDYMMSQIEYAVLEGWLPYEFLDMVHGYVRNK